MCALDQTVPVICDVKRFSICCAHDVKNSITAQDTQIEWIDACLVLFNDLSVYIAKFFHVSNVINITRGNTIVTWEAKTEKEQ